MSSQKTQKRIRIAAALMLASAFSLAVPQAARADDDRRGRRHWQDDRGGRHERGRGNGRYERHERRDDRRHYRHENRHRQYERHDRGNHHRHHYKHHYNHHDKHYWAPWRHHHSQPSYYYPEAVPSYHCAPHGVFFAGYDELYGHVHHAHGVPHFEVPGVLVSVGVGWVFDF